MVLTMQIRTRQDVELLLGEIESVGLEFKSARQLSGTDGEIKKFISDKIVPVVSAFLNTEGGTLVIGIEERDNKAAEIRGVSDRIMKWDRLQSMIVDRIHPACADLVSVQRIEVGFGPDGDRLQAFCVTVRAGITAYQSNDKRYYARRAGETFPMEDKDIRLRMLASDKPRIDAKIVIGRSTTADKSIACAIDGTVRIGPAVHECFR